jgi:uncharacterized protein (DUF342 family)
MPDVEPLNPEDPAGQKSAPLLLTAGTDSRPEKPPEISYELAVSEDSLKAHLFARVEGSPSINVEDLKKFLKTKGICFGLVDDRKIGEYISQGAILQAPCLIAEGQPPTPGQDAQVTYSFDRDPLKIGSIGQGGAIDFKNKGEIPQVKEGDLLGEKIPLVKEKTGKDVFGKLIPADPAKDILFSPGTGTKRSSDGLKIFAQISGRPELLRDGKVCVFPELKIRGDVGLATGHIRFDGFVDVEGTVQEGYKVRAGRLAAREIYRAEVEVDGDIVVDGGLVGAKVKTRGNLKTRFIHSSQIIALGDVVVEREVIDSKIETNGALIAIPAGKIFTSQITAKRGISANQIGSKASRPCALTVGVDTLTKNTIKKMTGEISAKEEEKKRINTAIERLTLGLREAKENIVKYVQIQDQAKIQQQTYQRIIEELKSGGDPAKLTHAERELKKIEDKMKNREEPLKKLMEQQNHITDKISTLQIQAENLDSAIQGLNSQIQKTMDDSLNKEIPPVKVLKQIYAGTLLEGCHSSLVLKESLEGVLVQETKNINSSPEGKESSEWNMQISSLS